MSGARLLVCILSVAVFLSGERSLAEPRSQFNQNALDEYVHKKDEVYQCRLVRSEKANGYQSHFIELVSQRYLTESEVDQTDWRHLLQVVEPATVKHQTAMLMIGGGSNSDAVPSSINELLVRYALATSSVVAELSMVPNQPLVFKDEGKKRWEDALIAYTWDKFLTSGDSRWPARMAMTKSAVSAMDCLQSLFPIASEKKPNKFVVAGASKRGWTTWTTAAVDARVSAIVPIVIDLLDVERSFRHHWEVYGFWAPAIQDYVDMGTVEWWGTPELQALFKLVDPLSYKDRYTMPKFLVNAAGDEFFVPTSSQFYFDQLPGEKFLRYVPNAGHSLADSDALESILAYYAAVLNDFPRPQFSWEFGSDGSIRVSTKQKPSQVSLWKASNKENRDFRKDTIGKNGWKRDRVEAFEDGDYLANIRTPKEGWSAYFVELKYETPFGIPFTFSTPVRVTPDTLPFKYEPPANPRKGFLTDK